MLAGELMFRNEIVKIDGHLWIGNRNHCCNHELPRLLKRANYQRVFFDSNGSELRISWRLRSADTHASQGGIVSQHQLAKRDTLSR